MGTFYFYLTSVLLFALVWVHVAPQITNYLNWKEEVGNNCYEARPLGDSGVRGLFFHWRWETLTLRTFPICEDKQ